MLMFLTPVTDVDAKGPNMAAIHVVPKFNAVIFWGWQDHTTDKVRHVSPLTHWAVNIYVVTWGRNGKVYQISHDIIRLEMQLFKIWRK